MSHCGWTNYETWAVALWIENTEESYLHWLAQAEQAVVDAPESLHVQKWHFTTEDAARIKLADELRESHEDGNPIGEPCLYSDLLNAALSEVDWYEIACHLIDEVNNR